VVAQVAEHAGDVVGHQAADRPRGVDADHNLAGGIEDEPGGLEESAVWVDEGAGRFGDGFGVGTVTDRERSTTPNPPDRSSGRLIVPPPARGTVMAGKVSPGLSKVIGFS
jgi:hypothetical protein